MLEKFIEIEASVTNGVGKAIRTLRTDNGGEYLSTELFEGRKELDKSSNYSTHPNKMV